jgi:hypothetical protein
VGNAQTVKMTPSQTAKKAAWKRAARALATSRSCSELSRGRARRLHQSRPRKDHRGIDVMSDVLPFGRLWYGEPNAVANAIGYAEHRSRSHDAVIRVYDEAGKVIQTGIKFNEKSFRFTTQMRDFTTIVTVFATKMIPLLRAGFNWNSPISLIGIRAALGPSPAENRMDVYDDIILRVIDGSITQWVTSTDPSKGVSHDANQRPKVRSSTL